MKIPEFLRDLDTQVIEDKPIRLKVNSASDLQILEKGLSLRGIGFIKPIKDQLHELKEVFELNSELKSLHSSFDDFLKKTLGENMSIAGEFFYFGWGQRVVVQVLPDKFHYELISWRNKNKLLPSEQLTLKNSRVGIIGSSVGSFATKTLSKLGVGHIKIAELKNIKPSNTPRIYVDSIRHYGEHKLTPLAQNIYEFNPYIKIDKFLGGFNEQNSKEFFGVGREKVDIIVDAADDAGTKILIRKLCQDHGIPLVTGFDEKGCIIVERFDQEGYLSKSPKLSLVDLENLKQTDIRSYTMKLLEFFPGGYDNLSARQKSTIEEVFNKSLGGFSQLSWEAALFGGYIAKAVCDILTGSEVCGVYMIDLDEKFDQKKPKDDLKLA